MTKKKDDHVFIKLDITAESAALLKESCDYYHWTRSHMIRAAIDMWNAEWLVKKAQLIEDEIDSSQA